MRYTPLLKIILSFLVLILFWYETPVFAARSVALVYDDSSSMNDNVGSWRYANYALQGLVAFLGEDDYFSLILMSKPSNVKNYRGNQAKLHLIKELKKSTGPSGSTPYQAIQTARERLKTAGNSDEKWLIILTDGEFFDHNLDESVRNALEHEANDFVIATGSHTVLLVIGKKGDQTLKEILQKTSQATILQASDSDSIIERLHETAAMMTSHSGSSSDLQESRKDSTMQISPKFPLRKLTVFLQSKDKISAPPRIQSVTIHNGTGRTDTYQLSLISSSRKKDRSQSSIVHITPISPATLIHEGKDQITIAFDKQVNDFEYKLYPEVAAKLDIQLRDSADGILTMNSGQSIEVCEDALLSLHAKLTTESGKTLTEGQNDISPFEVNYLFDDRKENAMRINLAHTEFTAKIKPNPGDTTISVKAAYPGYFDLRSQIYTLRTIDCQPRVLSIISDDSNWHESLIALPSSKVLLSATVDGQPMQDIDFADAEMRIVSDTDVDFSVFKDEQNHQWQLLPHFKWWCACFTPTGEQKVEVLLTGARKNEKEKQDLTLKVTDVSWWDKCGKLVIFAIILLLFIWYFVGIIKKPRFRSGSIVKYTRRHRTQTEHLPGSWGSRWLIPYIPEKRYIGSLLFIAGIRSSYVLLSNKTQSADMTINGLSIEDPGRRDVRLSNSETLLVNARQAESYTYSSQ